MRKLLIEVIDKVPEGEIWFFDSTKMLQAKVTRKVDEITENWEPSELQVFKRQLKNNIDLMLQEKTGWGRVELMRRLIEVIDQTGQSDIHRDAEDLPF